MDRFIQAAKAFGRDEEGATAIEYGLLAALIALVIAAGVKVLGENLNTFFKNVADTIKGFKTTV